MNETFGYVNINGESVRVTLDETDREYDEMTETWETLYYVTRTDGLGSFVVGVFEPEA